MSESESMRQEAPYPTELADIVDRMRYRPKWTFALTDKDRGQSSAGLTFEVYTVGYNTYHVERGQTYGVVHYFPVPPAAYNRQSWLRWVLDRLIEVETHEACEFFALEDAGGEVRPFAPVHAPGYDPYMVTTVVSDEARRTSFRGELKPE